MRITARCLAGGPGREPPTARQPELFSYSRKLEKVKCVLNDRPVPDVLTIRLIILKEFQTFRPQPIRRGRR